MKIAVLGAGSWGTVFAKVLADAGGDVTVWGRRAVVVDAINETRRNPDYVPDCVLPERLRATSDVAAALDGAPYAVLAVATGSGPWHGLPVFSAWVTEVEEAE